MGLPHPVCGQAVTLDPGGRHDDDGQTAPERLPRPRLRLELRLLVPPAGVAGDAAAQERDGGARGPLHPLWAADRGVLGAGVAAKVQEPCPRCGRPR